MEKESDREVSWIGASGAFSVPKAVKRALIRFNRLFRTQSNLHF